MRAHFPFNSKKATEVAALFIEHEGGAISLIKLIKLAYLLDRTSIEKRGIPVLGGAYFSMKNGPVTSELLNLAGDGELFGEETNWSQFISDRAEHQVGLLESPGTRNLSRSEIKLVEEIIDQFGSIKPWDLVEWCHKHLGEWAPIDQGRRDITIRSLCEALDLDEDAAKAVESAAEELSFVECHIRPR